MQNVWCKCLVRSDLLSSPL